jgi:hypothetical protein
LTPEAEAKISIEKLNKEVQKEEKGITFIIDGVSKYVKMGTVECLVDFLADPTSSDVTFLQLFIFSHKVFVDSFTLLKMLMTRFRVQVGTIGGVPSLARWVCYFTL